MKDGKIYYKKIKNKKMKIYEIYMKNLLKKEKFRNFQLMKN